MKLSFIYTFFILVVFFSSKLNACTGLLLNATDQSIVTGRTVEFAEKLPMTLAVVPRNFQFAGQTPLGKGLPYQAKYAAIGIYCFSNQILMDGMNEKGLVAAAFFFPGYAEYTPTTSQNQKNSLSPVDFTNWILTQFSSIDEILKALPNISISPTVLQGWGNTPPPFHYVVYDASGHSIVIEPIQGQLVVYQNPIGSMTNSPTFDWHLTNLDNYINLSTFNAKPIQIRGMTFQIDGQGSGLNGLPGGFSSTARFVRATIFATSALPPSNPAYLPNQAFHILNQFDIPLGSVRDASSANVSYDFTQLTTVKDPNTLKYYYRSYENQNIQYVNLNEVNLNANSIKTLKINGFQTETNNSSELL